MNSTCVKGCDASVLVSSKPGMLAERDADDNKELAQEAFDAVDMAKALVERNCPAVVSCADILAIAARDFVHLVSKPSVSFKVKHFFFNTRLMENN